MGKEPETNICESTALSVDAAASRKIQRGAAPPAAPDRAASALPGAFHLGRTAGGGRAVEACDHFHRWRGTLDYEWAGDAVCLCGQSVSHPLAIRRRQTSIAHLVLVCACVDVVYRGASQSVALDREPRFAVGLNMMMWTIQLAPYSIAVFGAEFFRPSRLRHSAQHILSDWGWGHFHENGRALPRLGRRMHQMGGRGAYGRSARVISGARAHLARYRLSHEWAVRR